MVVCYSLCNISATYITDVLLITAALSPDLTVNRIHSSAVAVGQPHNWRDKFLGLTCRIPLKSVALLIFKFHKVV